MQTSESRGGRGIGILILRHEDYPSQPPYEESSRMGLLGKSVKGMQSKEAGGKYIDVENSVGDVMPDFLWAKDSRAIPGRNWIWPAVVGGSDAAPITPSNSPVVFSGAAGSTQNGGTVNAMTRSSGDPQSQGTLKRQATPSAQNKTVVLPSESVGMMLPVIGTDMHPDNRFSPIGYAIPMDDGGRGPLWPKFYKGMYGLALPSTNEPQQQNLLYPCDPRLIAVNNGNDPDMGSMVCDTSIDDDSIDMGRVARLQSAFRVVVKKDRSTNSIAFQLTFAENEDCEGGLVIDHFANDVIGRLSFLNEGPLDVGDFNDPHRQSFDDDGNPINPVHLSLQSLFKHKTLRDMDGPLLHEGYWKGAQTAPIRTNVHFEWDPGTRTHRWAGESWMYKPNTPTGGPPTTETPPTKGPPKSPPNEPSGGGNPPAEGPPPGGVPDIPWNPDGGSPAGGVPPGDDGFDQYGIGSGNDTSRGDGKGAGGGGGGGGGGPKDGGGKPGNPRRPDEGGGGVIPVGPLPPGSGHPKWKNPDGTDPFWPFGFKGGKNGSDAKQKARAAKKAAKDARKKAKKDKKKDKAKGKFPPIIWHEPPEDKLEPPLPQGWGWIDWWGKPPRGGLGKYLHPVGAPTPNVFSPNIHPGGPGGRGGGSPTPVTSPTSLGITYSPGGMGPMPSGALPGPQFPPAMVNEVMMPSMLARGQNFSYSAPDLRYDPAPSSDDIQNHDQTAPISGHMQAYYAHGGAVGSNVGLGAPNQPIYTQRPRTGRFWGGTSNGGWWITAPEIDLADQNSDFNPQNVTQSTTYFGVAPQVYFGAGLPDLASGGMRSGYRWGADRNGNSTFDRVDSSGVVTPILDLGADGIVTVFARGSGAGQGGQLVLESANGVNTVSLQAPDSAASDLVFVMPDVDPVATQVLTVASIVGSTVTLEWTTAGAPSNGMTTLYATAVQTATTAVVTKEILKTYSIPGATMSGDGDAIVVRAWGSFAANANAKTVRLEIGAGPTVLAYNNITPSPNGGSWAIEAKIMYRNAGQQTSMAQVTVGAVVQSVASTLTNENPANPITIYVSGQNGVASAGDIICDGIEVENAPA